MSALWRAVLCALGRHETQAVTHCCGCDQEKCEPCGAWRRWVCDDHMNIANLRSEQVGVWR